MITHRYAVPLLLALIVCSCTPDTSPQQPTPPAGILTAGFVVLEGVYNSELMAPYDILHHSIFRDSVNYIAPFVVSADGTLLTTFEGIDIIPHHSFETAPPIDILVIPSTAQSMDADLADTTFMGWLHHTVQHARFVISVCDGAFPLVATGLADGREVTTFPADRGRLAEMFPKVNVLKDVRLVADGKFITSVGGARSYEPALYLTEILYGADHARQTAKGLVLDWDLALVPHAVTP